MCLNIKNVFNGVFLYPHLKPPYKMKVSFSVRLSCEFIMEARTYAYHYWIHVKNVQKENFYIDEPKIFQSSILITINNRVVDLVKSNNVADYHIVTISAESAEEEEDEDVAVSFIVKCNKVYYEDWLSMTPKMEGVIHRFMEQKTIEL